MSNYVPTYWAKIFIGARPSYDQNVSDDHLDIIIDEIKEECQIYCDRVGLGLTVTPLDFIYTGGREKGVEIGLINYPRFPSTKAKIQMTALDIARNLRETFQQERVSVMFPDFTFMLDDGHDGGNLSGDSFEEVEATKEYEKMTEILDQIPEDTGD